MITIPDQVLEKIAVHRPHLGVLVRNLRASPAQARQIEKAIADAYLLGETKLTGSETYKLSACCVSRPYGSTEI